MGRKPTRESAVLREYVVSWGHYYEYWCPGCEDFHGCHTRTGSKTPSWSFDNNMECPTFNPSINYYEKVCHYFIRKGKFHYCGDCTHELKGKIVGMVPLDTIDLKER